MTTLTLEDPDEQVEFQLATCQAVENKDIEFIFHGQIVRTAAAIDAVTEIIANRTYH